MDQVIQTSSGELEFRIDGKGDSVILVLNAGHCARSDSFVPFGSELKASGFRLLVPSRPGYGRTPSSTGKTAEEFADCLEVLCDRLHLPNVNLLAISAGGKTALQFAQRHPTRVNRMILLSALAHNRWPTRKKRLLSYLLFHPLVEKRFWSLSRWMFRKFPIGALKFIMNSFTKLPTDQVVEQMECEQIQAFIDYLCHLRSESGFLLDIQHQSGDLQKIQAPTLIVHSRYDKSVPVSHAKYAADRIPKSELMMTEAESHLIWFSKHRSQIERRMIQFLT